MTATNLHYCVVDDRAVFLDVAADRYFCLPEALDGRFRAATATGDLPTEAALEILVSAGLPRDSAVTMSRACAPQPPALDLAPASAGLLDIAEALSAMIAARWRLRRRGLAASLAHVTRLRRREGNPPAVAGEQETTVVAGAFDRVATLISGHDQCLTRSLAIAAMLQRRHIAASVIFGVALNPFRAHCWVQAGSVLVGERLEVTAPFIPILVH